MEGDGEDDGLSLDLSAMVGGRTPPPTRPLPSTLVPSPSSSASASSSSCVQASCTERPDHLVSRSPSGLADLRPRHALVFRSVPETFFLEGIGLFQPGSLDVLPASPTALASLRDREPVWPMQNHHRGWETKLLRGWSTTSWRRLIMRGALSEGACGRAG